MEIQTEDELSTMKTTTSIADDTNVMDTETIFSTIATSIDEKQLNVGLRTWTKYLLIDQGMLPDRDDYFRLLCTAFLRNTSSDQHKYCLAILKASIEQLRLKNDYAARHPSWYQYMKWTDKGNASINLFCHIFEIMVLGRYVNQVQECLVELSSMWELTSKHAPMRDVPDVLFNILLNTVLSSNNDQIKRLAGNWLLQNYVVYGPDDLPEDSDFRTQEDLAFEANVRHVLLDTALTWAMSGQLAFKTLSRERRQVKCLHGDMLSSWCRDQTKISVTVFAEHVLQWLSDRINSLNQHTTVYIMAGLSSGDINMTETIYRALNKIASGVNFSPLCRYTVRKLCLRLMEKYKQKMDTEVEKVGKVLDGSSDTVCQLRKQIQESEDTISGDVGIFLHPTVIAMEMQQRARSCMLTMVSEKYIELADGKIIIDWDRLIRYDPHQALWQQFAESWICWAQDMLHAESQSLHAVDFAAHCIAKFFKLSRSKTFLWPATAWALRDFYVNKAPEILRHDQVKQALLEFINEPPAAAPEYLLDIAAISFVRNIHTDMYNAAEINKKEEQGYTKENNARCPSIGYADDALGHALVFDLLNRLRLTDSSLAGELLNSLLEPWTGSNSSHRKSTSQLQAMIILLSSVKEPVAYSPCFVQMLDRESNPRYRFLLEWGLLLIHVLDRSCEQGAQEIMATLEQTDAANPNPKLVGSQVRLAVQLVLHRPGALEAPRLARLQEFSRLLTILSTLINSSRTPVRFEAQASFATVFEYIQAHSLVEELPCGSVFHSIHKFITGLDKYKEPLDARILGAFTMATDMNLATLFEGGYLYIPQEEAPLLHACDMEEAAGSLLDVVDCNYARPAAHMRIGRLNDAAQKLIATIKQRDTNYPATTSQTASAPLQTKSLSLDLASLGFNEPSQNKSGTGPILIGTLLDAPVNLGGLSRAANVFGCHSLHVPSLSILQNNAFKNVSLNSELHLQIEETKIDNLVERLVALKHEGWTIVALEQTSDSIVIGAPSQTTEKSKKQLPQKVVIVMGAESTGVPAQILIQCDLCVEIKQWGVTRSLNVQTAAACVLFEWRREWGHGRISDT